MRENNDTKRVDGVDMQKKADLWDEKSELMKDVEEYLLRGVTQIDIARELHISESLVSQIGRRSKAYQDQKQKIMQNRERHCVRYPKNTVVSDDEIVRAILENRLTQFEAADQLGISRKRVWRATKNSFHYQQHKKEMVSQRALARSAALKNVHRLKDKGCSWSDIQTELQLSDQDLAYWQAKLAREKPTQNSGTASSRPLASSQQLITEMKKDRTNQVLCGAWVKPAE